MSKSQRDKGKQGEREVAELLRSQGITARRGRQYAGHPDSPDVVAEIPGVYIEVKRRERGNVAQWVDDALGDCIETGDECMIGSEWVSYLVPVVYHRASRKPWLVTLRAEDVPRFVQAWLKATGSDSPA